MASVRFISFLLVLLLIFQHARFMIADTIEDMKATAADGNQNAAVEVNAVNDEKIVLDAAPAMIEIGKKKKLEGRKMLAEKDLSKETGQEGDLVGANSKDSGEHIYATKKLLRTSKDHTDRQNERDMLKAKKMKSASSIRSSSKANESKSQVSENAFQILESNKNMDMFNFVMELMTKDYKGAGKPQHKPPINNNQPRN